MKRYLIVLILLIFGLTSHAEVLQGGVSYDVDSARDDLMESVSYTIKTDEINGFYTDAEYEQNANYMLKGVTDLKDRTLAYFSDGTYAVQKKDDPYKVYYYGAAGVLMYVEKKQSLEYPYKSYKYNTAGKLVNMSLRVSKSETYIYAKDGKLLAHWVKSNAYDEHGNIIMKRRYVE